jgi:hypothetical protein
MPSLNPIGFCRALARRRCGSDAPTSRFPLLASRVPQPTIYIDAPMSRVLIAIERQASDLELALAEYVRARRAAGVQPETVLVEFKRMLRRAVGLDVVKPSLTGRLIELYFAG